MTRLQARDPATWTWGHLHRLDLVNPTLGASGVSVVETLFNRGPYEVGGGVAPSTRRRGTPGRGSR